MMFLSKTLNVKLVWIDKEEFRAGSYKLKYAMRTEPNDDLSNIKELGLYQNLSYQTVNHFISEYVNNAVVYATEDMKTILRYIPEYTNTLVSLPTLNESCFLTALYRKLDCIIHEDTMIETLELIDTADELSYTVFDEPVNNFLPEQSDWMGPLSFFKESWWDRRDFSTFDNVAESKEELEKWDKDIPPQLEKCYNTFIEEMSAAINGELEEELPKPAGEVISLDFGSNAKPTPKKPTLRVVSKTKTNDNEVDK